MKTGKKAGLDPVALREHATKLRSIKPGLKISKIEVSTGNAATKLQSMTTKFNKSVNLLERLGAGVASFCDTSAESFETLDNDMAAKG